MASTEKGRIDVYYDRAPSSAKLSSQAIAGNITVHAPKSMQALVQAKVAERGEVVCEHELTLSPRVTQLNKDAWSQMRKEVKGTLGSKKNGRHQPDELIRQKWNHPNIR